MNMKFERKFTAWTNPVWALSFRMQDDQRDIMPSVEQLEMPELRSVRQLEEDRRQSPDFEIIGLPPPFFQADTPREYFAFSLCVPCACKGIRTAKNSV